MKKVLKVILIILVLILFGLGVFFGIKFIKDKKSGVQEIVPENEFSLAWKKMDTVDEIMYIPNCSAPTKTETLVSGFTKSSHVNISIPNKQTLNLFGSSVYAVDGSFSILISNNLGKLDMGSSILNSENLSEDVVCTKDGDATVHVACKMFDDFTITAYVYSNSEDWSIIRDSIQSLEPITEIPVNSNVTPITFEEITEVGTSVALSGSLNDTMVPKDVYMNNGVFRSMLYPLTFTKATQSAQDYIRVLSNGNPIRLYSASDIMYLESNGYSIGIIGSDNDEYVQILFGVGDEARANVMGLLL